MKKLKINFQNIMICFLACCIPVLLAVASIEIKRYASLEREVTSLQSKQYKLIEENRRLVSEIGVLSSSERIEQIALDEYGMRPAESAEIVRVQIKGN